MMIWDKVIGLGEQWLTGKQEVGKAKVKAEVASLKAKITIAQTVAERTFDLDRMAVQEAAKSWWDEFLCLIYLSPFLMQVWAFFFVSYQPAADHAMTKMQELTLGYYMIGVAMIGVRYLGFRNLFRTWLQGKYGMGKK